MRAILARSRLPLLLMLLAAALTLGGCSSKNTRDTQSGADILYERAQSAMESSNYRNAISYYESLAARFPFSNQAKQAQLDLIYCYYKNGERESAIDAANQFERENPTHPRVDYALYMRGLATFTGEAGVIQRFFRIDPAQRPLDRADESFAAFAQLVQRYPQSSYAADARQRMVFLRNRLAEHENNVARYYLSRRAYLAAIQRAQFAVQSYNGAPAVADSLGIMLESYQALGMSDLADSTREVLVATFPEVMNEDATDIIKKPWYRFW